MTTLNERRILRARSLVSYTDAEANLTAKNCLAAIRANVTGIERTLADDRLTGPQIKAIEQALDLLCAVRTSAV